MRYTAYITLLLALVAFSSKAQLRTKKEAKAYMVADLYTKPDGQVLRLAQPVTNKVPWIVFSDRSNNKFYLDPDGKTEALYPIYFLEAFYVIGENDSFVHLVRYDMAALSEKGIIKKNAEDYGWARKSKMLLWKRALLDSSGALAQKALVVLNKDDYYKENGISNYFNDTVKLKLYQKPEASTIADRTYVLDEKDNLCSNQMVYIYKKEKDKYLVGSSDLIAEPMNPKYYVWGWVPDHALLFWSHRLCLKPNKDFKSTSKDSKIQNVCFFPESKKKNAMDYQNGNNPSDEILQLSLIRDNHEQKLPVLNVDKNGLIETRIFTDFMHSDLPLGMTFTNDLFKKNCQNVINEAHKINIVFVAEVSASTIPYYNSAVNGIKKAYKENQENNKAFQLGAVVYGRKFIDSTNKYANNVKSNSFDKIGGLFTFLDTMPKTISNTHLDSLATKDSSTFLFPALLEAAKMCEGHKLETNYIILIGSGGNCWNDPVFFASEVSEALAKNHCSIAAFQLIKPNSANTYAFFVDDLKKILDGININVTIETNQITHTKTEAAIKEIPGRIEIDYPAHGCFRGHLSYADKDHPVFPAYCEDTIVSTIKQIESNIDDNEQMVNERKDQLKNQINSFDDGLLYFLARLGLSNAQWAEMKKYYFINHNQYYEKAYTSLRINGIDDSLYKFYTFLSSQEVNSIIEGPLKRISKAKKAKEIKKILLAEIRAAIPLAYNYDDEKTRYVMVDNLPISKGLYFITGTTSASPLLKKYKIGDLDSRRKINKADCKLLMEYFAKKYKDLSEYSKRANISFQSSHDLYTWIPIDMLP